jgi:hypothetical protein
MSRAPANNPLPRESVHLVPNEAVHLIEHGGGAQAYHPAVADMHAGIVWLLLGLAIVWAVTLRVGGRNGT